MLSLVFSQLVEGWTLIKNVILNFDLHALGNFYTIIYFDLIIVEAGLGVMV